MPNSTLQEVRTALADLSKAGRTSVDIPALSTFLDALERDLPIESEIRKLNHESQLAQQKLEQERNLAHYRATVDGETEMFRSVIETAKATLNTSILVNGGASVALLALLGNLVGRPQPISPALQQGLIVSLAFFAAGVLSGAIATSSTYLSQFCYHNEYRRTGIAFHSLTVVLVLSTYVTFALGLSNAYYAFRP
jgi:hypothetical protein